MRRVGPSAAAGVAAVAAWVRTARSCAATTAAEKPCSTYLQQTDRDRQKNGDLHVSAAAVGLATLPRVCACLCLCVYLGVRPCLGSHSHSLPHVCLCQYECVGADRSKARRRPRSVRPLHQARTVAGNARRHRYSRCRLNARRAAPGAVSISSKANPTIYVSHKRACVPKQSVRFGCVSKHICLCASMLVRMWAQSRFLSLSPCACDQHVRADGNVSIT
jgi:hypothetical protein